MLLNSKTNIVITGSSGHTSQVSLQAVKDAYASLRDYTTYIGILNAGDLGAVFVFRGTANAGAVFYFSYSQNGQIEVLTVTASGWSAQWKVI